MGSGFYLMHRGWLENPVFGGKREPYDRRSAWAWLIEHAVFAPTTVSISGRLVELKRGQLSYSLRDLASRWGWSEAKVRRYCVAVASAKMISCVTDAGQMVITICNYEKYQHHSRVGDADEGASVTQRRRSADAHNKERERIEDSEEADASSAAPVALDLAGELIKRCTTWLHKATGRSEKQLRGLVVGWLRDYGDGLVVEVFTSAARAPPLEPISWISAQLKRRAGANGHRSSAADKHTDEINILGQAAVEFDERAGDGGYPETAH